MSWSVSGSGKAAEVAASVASQFEGPLADPPAGLADDGERATVALIAEVIEQCLSTFDSEREVLVSANGHMGYSDYATCAGAYQNVTLQIVGAK